MAGQVSVMAFPVFIPAFAAAGLAFVDRESGWTGWPVWGYIVVWLAGTFAAWGATIYAGRLGARPR